MKRSATFELPTRVAQSASGSAAIAPVAVPRIASWRVSKNADRVRSDQSWPQSGSSSPSMTGFRRLRLSISSLSEKPTARAVTIVKTTVPMARPIANRDRGGRAGSSGPARCAEVTV